jgi:hypothetical protein
MCSKKAAKSRAALTMSEAARLGGIRGYRPSSCLPHSSSSPDPHCSSRFLLRFIRIADPSVMRSSTVSAQRAPHEPRPQPRANPHSSLHARAPQRRQRSLRGPCPRENDHDHKRATGGCNSRHFLCVGVHRPRKKRRTVSSHGSS